MQKVQDKICLAVEKIPLQAKKLEQKMQISKAKISKQLVSKEQF